jgi:serine O-acetyltransferase
MSDVPGVRRTWRRLRADLRVVMERDPSVRTVTEACLASYLPALWLHRLAHPLYQHNHRVLARILSLLGRILSGGCDIHPGARIGSGLFIDHAAAVVIGEEAVIGADVTLFHQVTLGAVGWWRDSRRLPGERRHPTVGDGVVIGTGASVLGPVHIGDRALVGAHCVITCDIPAGSRVSAPASVVRPRSAPRPPLPSETHRKESA